MVVYENHSIEERMKGKRDFSSSEIIYHLLNNGRQDKKRLLRAFTDWMDKGDGTSGEDFFRLLDILKKEGLIAY